MNDLAPGVEEARLPASRQWTAADEEALLVGMIEHYTPSGQERPLAAWLRDQLIPRGLHAEVDAVGDVIVELPPTELSARPEAGPVILLGHLDTVPGFIPPHREGDLLYGRGAVDAKGPLAAFLAATMRLHTREAPRERAVIVVGAVEEEAATSRGARAVLQRYLPAAVVIGEPSAADAITLAYKGRLLVHCRIARPMAHTARPEESVCARAVAMWAALESQAREWNERHHVSTVFGALQPSLRAIHSSSDGFTEECVLEIGYRLPPGLEADTLEQSIEEVAGVYGAEVSFRGAGPAYEGTRGSMLVSAFVRAMRAEGMTPGFKRKTGTSDMNVVGPVWRCPIVAYGPGDSALDHTPHEHVQLSEFARAIAVLERVLTDLTMAPAAPLNASGE